MSGTTTQTRTAGRGRRGGRGRGGARGSHRDKTAAKSPIDDAHSDARKPSQSAETAASHGAQSAEVDEAAESQPSVIFTTSPDMLWSSYTPDLIPYKDSKLSVSFETQEMMEETLILLRFNCPDSDCDYIGNGWSDLKLHTRAAHGKLMCDLCIRFKKIFAHEHALYAPNQLPLHLPAMQRSHARNPDFKSQIEGGIHPLCEFCRECFFSDDELYTHMREKHEECFVCKRNEVRDQYFRNYDALEQHFTHAHFPCNQPHCLTQKFVVFGSALDLKAHMVEEHGAEMSTRDKKDARRIQAEFEFEEVGTGNRRGRRDRRDREREREPPPAPIPPGVSRPNGAGGRRREAFNGNLTVDGSTVNGNLTTNPHASRRPSPSPPPIIEGDAERNFALVARIQSLTPHANTAVPAIQAAIRSYRASESAARDLISTIWNILDRNLDGTANVVNLLVESLEEDDKKRDLLAAWNGFKIEQRGQFPDLVPTSIGTQWAGVTSGRVLNAKHSTSARLSSQSSRQVWDRVAKAAASSSAPPQGPSRPPERFPSLQPSVSSGGVAPFRQSQRVTPWAASAASTLAPPRGPSSVPGPGASTSKTAPVLSKSAFPELPSSNVLRVPRAAIKGNQSLKNILGDSTPAVPAWNSVTNASGTASPGEGDVESNSTPQESGTGKGKKGKGKQKQTLFTLGSFPS
ncbi:uncharacterized protein FIBRA_02524 [Fibroporia radiculosa]|uniref:C2H2-type domain-containing protein n=1 Tax=Fibroporia radiculosa TaxID=599839 RepID=J4GMY1_9APHY|nr:uncharacterized protein FIBRA_02524 [Fibroporia radiculosa]CCM00490.1 predicted protein [Fibroporia radiculosa]